MAKIHKLHQFDNLVTADKIRKLKAESYKLELTRKRDEKLLAGAGHRIAIAITIAIAIPSFLSLFFYGGIGEGTIILAVFFALAAGAATGLATSFQREEAEKRVLLREEVLETLRDYGHDSES